MSIAGGHHKAVECAAAVGCDCLQIFTANPRSFPAFPIEFRFGQFLTKNTNQWRGKPIAADEAQRFRESLAASGIACPLAHDSYLINLASPEETLWKKSIAAMIDEVQRAALSEFPGWFAIPGPTPLRAKRRGLTESSPRWMRSSGGPTMRRPASCWKPRLAKARRSARALSIWRRFSRA